MFLTDLHKHFEPKPMGAGSFTQGLQGVAALPSSINMAPNLDVSKPLFMPDHAVMSSFCALKTHSWSTLGLRQGL